MERPEWHKRAVCRGAGTALFFLEHGDPSAPRARALCASCPVREECLEFALTDPAGRCGIWGGTTEKDRRHLRQERRLRRLGEAS